MLCIEYKKAKVTVHAENERKLKPGSPLVDTAAHTAKEVFLGDHTHPAQVQRAEMYIQTSHSPVCPLTMMCRLKPFKSSRDFGPKQKK